MVTLIERLLALAELWAATNDRSSATLASRVVRDGKLFERLAGGASCTAATAERFFVFFRDAENWRDGVIPDGVSSMLDGVDLGVSAHADADIETETMSSPGKSEEISRSSVAA